MQMREENAKRQHDNAAQQLRTCTDHRCTMDALLNPDGVPPEFLNGTDNSEAASLAQQPWYRVLYVAQVTRQALAPPQHFQHGYSFAQCHATCRLPQDTSRDCHEELC